LSLPALAPDTVAALERVVPAEASTANPVDLLGSATAATYEAALPIVLADPGVDAVIVLFVPPVVATTADVSAAIARATATADKPVLPVVISADGSPVGSFTYPESAARALGLAARRASWLRRPASEAPYLERIDQGAAAAVVARVLGETDDAWLEPGDLRALLTAYGVPLVGERTAADADAAAAAAEELGYPVVVKTAAAGAHKTETGGVHIDLRDGAAVRRACEAVNGPVLVQQYITGGVELLAGAIQDPVFGPLVAFGPGGVYAELIGSTRFALAPLGEIDVDELISSGKAAKLVDGWRGAPPADRAAVADLIHRLGRLADDVPEIAELDLNPVIARPDGCVAVDARVRLRRPEPTTSAKTW
jgi:acyl-CoA synthetase (NDP forming)